MTEFKKEDPSEILMFSRSDTWKSSIESIVTQRVTKLTKSDTLFKIPSNIGSDLSFYDLDYVDINQEESKPKLHWELVHDRSRFPRLIKTRSLIRDELEILRINMTNDDKVCQPAVNNNNVTVKKRKFRKFILCFKKSDMRKISRRNITNLIEVIEESELAKRDKVVWKFLKRGPALRREFINARKFLLNIQFTGTHLQHAEPTRMTCPNCRFFVVTNVKSVSHISMKLSSLVLAVFGTCIYPHVFYVFKDTVHLCPLCKVYLGFCPAFTIIKESNHVAASEALKKKESLQGKAINVFDEKMVSASSTSAKNLFVESKLRLSDRVQVNVNNIAAIARQLQKGSKSNESLMAAAKSFALQEAAFENSETNLKKLKLLATHINNQIESLSNNCSKMELVLEQVRSMQR